MIEHLGLGVEITLEDRVTQKVDPIIRELERLKRTSEEVTKRVDANNIHLYGSFERYMRAQKIRDFNEAVRGTNTVLLTMTERLVRGTYSAERFFNSLNRAQAVGSFNELYNSIRRVQEQLSMMGFGMSHLQEKMVNQRAYNIMKYQMADLYDRIKLTKKAIEEMQNSPDSSKFQKEIELAKQSLKVYEEELRKARDMQRQLAKTHGLMIGEFRGKPIMFKPAETLAQRTANRLLGLSMLDMAYAADLAYKSIDKISKALVGTGYTAEEARAKITQVATSLNMLGTMLSTTVTVTVIAGTVLLVGFAKAFEEAQAKFQARTLSTDIRMKANVVGDKGINDEMARIWKETGEDWGEISNTMSDLELILGKMPTYKLGQLAEYGLRFAKVWDEVGATDSILMMNRIMDKFGVSSEQALDILTLGLKKTNGNLEEAGKYINKNIGSLKRMTSAGHEGAQAFERLSDAIRNSPTERLFRGLRSLTLIFKELWESGLGEVFGKIGDGLYKVGNALTTLLQHNPKLAKFLGYTLGISSAFIALIGPIAFITGTLVRFKGVIEGVSASIFGLSKGGLALLSPQAQMAKEGMDELTVAIAKFPNTLLSTIPLFYNFIRGIPYFIMNIAKANPMMVGLIAAFTAYKLNLFGVAESIDKVMNKVRESWNLAKQIVGGKIKFDKIEDYNRLTQVFAKIHGLGIIIRNVIRDWGKGSVFFSEKEVDLLKRLGLDGFATKLVDISGKVKRFWLGFKEGFSDSVEIGKKFIGEVWERFEGHLKTISDLLLDLLNGLNKMFGGEGNYTSLTEVMDKMLGMKDGFYELGRLVGTLMFGFIAFKGVGTIISAVTSPFRVLGKAIDDVSEKFRMLKGLFKGGVVGHAEVDVHERRRNGRGNGGNNQPPMITAVSGLDTPAHTPTVPVGTTRVERNNRNKRATIRKRVRDFGQLVAEFFSPILDPLAPIGRGATDVGRGFVEERQSMRRGVVTEFDRYREGRRRSAQNRAQRIGGGLARGARSVGRGISDLVRLPFDFITNNTKIGRSATQSVNRYRQSVNRRLATFRLAKTLFTGSPVQSEVQVGSRMGRKMEQRAQRIARFSTPLKRLVPERARNIGGALGRGIFTTAKAGFSTGRFFGRLTAGSFKVGGRIGRLLLRGIGGLVLKGLPRLFMLGLKAINILGWALMAWDIISLVFSNWGKIKAGAKKAWEWIKTDGKDMAIELMKWIRDKLGEAWEWVRTEGVKKFGKLVSAGIEKLGELAGKALEIGISIGKNIYDKVIEWIGNLVSKAKTKLADLVSDIPVVGGLLGRFFGGGGKSKKGVDSKVKKYAYGGIVNKPHFGIVGEDGEEAIIPLTKRQRGLELWIEAGKRLGVLPFAEGGIVGIPSPSRMSSPSIGSSSKRVLNTVVNIASVEGADDLNNRGKDLGEEFVKSMSKSLQANNIPMDGWKEQNIGKPMNQVVRESLNYAVRMVRGFTKGQNSTPTGTDDYLERQVHIPFRTAQGNSSTWGAGLIQNFISGMRSKSSAVVESAKYLADRVEKAFREGLDIHSPSRVMIELGKFAAIGIVHGLQAVDIKKFALKQVEELAAAYGGVSQVSKWIAQALMITGAPMSWLKPLTIMAMHESGGNPKAINLWDSNAKKGTPSKGLMQTIDPTFNAYKLPRYNDIWNPVHNAIASIRYIQDRYGSPFNTLGISNMSKGGGYRGYKDGGIITYPHMAYVGEEGEEAVIPLTKRTRAQQLLEQVSGRLGFDIVPKGRKSAYEPVVRGRTSQSPQSTPVSGTSSQQAVIPNKTTKSSQPVNVDNSITVQKLEIHFPKEMAGIGEANARKQALAIMKELQKVVREQRLRMGEKNLSLDDIILNL